MTITNKSLKEALNQYEESLQLTPRIRRLISAANFDLYYGPTPEGEDIDNTGEIYPGFCKALDEIKDSLEEVDELWIDIDCGSYSTKEPEGYTDEEGNYEEPFWDSIYHLERKEVLQHIVGKELQSYL